MVSRKCHGKCSCEHAKKVGEKTKVLSKHFQFCCQQLPWESHSHAPTKTSQEQPWKAELWKENLLFISFHSEEIPSNSCLECVLRFHGQASQRLFGGTEKPGGSRPAGTSSSTPWSLEPLRNKQSFLPRWPPASSSSAPQPVTPKSIFAWAVKNSSWAFCGRALLQPLFLTIFFPFLHGFSQWFLVLRDLTPNGQGLHFLKEVMASSSLSSGNPALLQTSTKAKESNFAQWQLDQVLAKRTNNFPAQVSVFALGLVLSYLNSSFNTQRESGVSERDLLFSVNGHP